MATTVLLIIKNSEVISNSKVNCVAQFSNGGASTVTVVGVNRLSPNSGSGPIIDDAVKLVGLSLPASTTTNGNFSLEFSAASNSVGDSYSLGYAFLLSDGTLVSNAVNAKVFIRQPTGLTTYEKKRLPPLGAMDFRANSQSGLAGAIR